MLKKEIPVGNQKGAFYTNFEMQQRADIMPDQFTMPPNLANVQGTPSPVSNNSAIHSTYGPPQIMLKPNQNNIKNRFGSAANAQDAYYGSGCFGKQSNPSIDYYGKYELEFAAQEQKGPLANQMGPFNQTSKADFVDIKPAADFHHPVKGELHHGVKPELVQQQQPQAQPQPHHKTADFHHTKPPNFHLNHPNFYNHNATTHNASVDGAQVGMQYNPNQYFPNEYNAAANDIETASPYYEHKAASAQNTYYGNMYGANNHSGADFHNVTETPYTAPSNGQLPNEHCDNFAYPQYFEGNQHQATGTFPLQANQLHQQNHIGGHNNPMQHNHHFNHGVGGVAASHYHVAQQHLNGNPHVSGSPMDNSNSSSDFNFLSNLANDFAPEYYQLS